MKWKLGIVLCTTQQHNNVFCFFDGLRVVVCFLCWSPRRLLPTMSYEYVVLVPGPMVILTENVWIKVNGSNVLGVQCTLVPVRMIRVAPNESEAHVRFVYFSTMSRLYLMGSKSWPASAPAFWSNRIAPNKSRGNWSLLTGTRASGKFCILEPLLQYYVQGLRYLVPVTFAYAKLSFNFQIACDIWQKHLYQYACNYGVITSYGYVESNSWGTMEIGCQGLQSFSSFAFCSSSRRSTIRTTRTMYTYVIRHIQYIQHTYSNPRLEVCILQYKIQYVICHMSC